MVPRQVPKAYLACTKPIRGDIVQFFITKKLPHKALSRTSLGRWTVEVVNRAYQKFGQTTPFAGSHDTRAHSSAWVTLWCLLLGSWLVQVGRARPPSDRHT